MVFSVTKLELFYSFGSILSNYIDLVYKTRVRDVKYLCQKYVLLLM